MQLHLNTLYVTLPDAYVHLENRTLRIDVEREKKLQVPLHHIGAVVCFGDVLVSPAAMHALADEGKSLVLLDRNGRFKARLEGPVSGNVLLRTAQFSAMLDAAKSLRLAAACVAGKLRNARYVLLRGARDTNDTSDADALRVAADALAANLRSVPVAREIDEVRGLEGIAAKTYFGAFGHLIRPDLREHFRMNGRTRRPPLDRLNALLSFLYSMLMNDCRSAVEGVGLDPQIGYLHVLRPGRAALALNLMEEFRPLLADRLALTLINRMQIQHDDLVIRDGGTVQIEDDARKRLIVAYQERKQDELQHPLLEAKTTVGLLPLLQARVLARAVRGELEGYLPFVAR